VSAGGEGFARGNIRNGAPGASGGGTTPLAVASSLAH